MSYYNYAQGDHPKLFKYTATRWNNKHPNVNVGVIEQNLNSVFFRSATQKDVYNQCSGYLCKRKNETWKGFKKVFPEDRLKHPNKFERIKRGQLIVRCQFHAWHWDTYHIECALHAMMDVQKDLHRAVQILKKNVGVKKIPYR